MQNIDGPLKTHRIDSSPRITMVRSYNFEHAGSAETFERLGGRIRLALLGCKERVSDIDPDRAREGTQIPERGSNPPDGL